MYQDACYVFEKPDEDVLMLVKDIGRFAKNGRTLGRSILIDPQPFNFVLNPDNGYPIVPYNAEFANPKEIDRDEYLLTVIEDIETMRNLKDVRSWLNEEYMVRQILKNSKLI